MQPLREPGARRLSLHFAHSPVMSLQTLTFVLNTLEGCGKYVWQIVFVEIRRPLRNAFDQRNSVSDRDCSAVINLHDLRWVKELADSSKTKWCYEQKVS